MITTCLFWELYGFSSSHFLRSICENFPFWHFYRILLIMIIVAPLFRETLRNFARDYRAILILCFFGYRPGFAHWIIKMRSCIKNVQALEEGLGWPSKNLLRTDESTRSRVQNRFLFQTSIKTLKSSILPNTESSYAQLSNGPQKYYSKKVTSSLIN